MPLPTEEIASREVFFTHAYTLVLRWHDDDQRWHVTVPALAGVDAVGATPTEALKAALAVIAAYDARTRARQAAHSTNLP